MKVRSGFVSNSSSTSFSLVGISFESEDEADKALGMSWYDYIKEHNLDYHYGDPDSWDQAFYIGLVMSGESDHSPMGDMKSDETKDQFEERVRNSFPEELRSQVSWHYESYYNG